jgi:hypothetical protein
MLPKAIDKIPYSRLPGNGIMVLSPATEDFVMTVCSGPCPLLHPLATDQLLDYNTGTLVHPVTPGQRLAHVC